MDEGTNAAASARTPGAHDAQVLERSVILAFVAAAGTSLFCLLGSDLHQFWMTCGWKLHSALTLAQ
jgi:hypothetical protein